MPAMRTYRVRQTRIVEVSANDVTGAARIATMAFDGKDVSSSRVVESELDIWGHSHGQVQTIGIDVEEKRL